MAAPKEPVTGAGSRIVRATIGARRSRQTDASRQWEHVAPIIASAMIGYAIAPRTPIARRLERRSRLVGSHRVPGENPNWLSPTCATMTSAPAYATGTPATMA